MFSGAILARNLAAGARSGFSRLADSLVSVPVLSLLAGAFAMGAIVPAAEPSHRILATIILGLTCAAALISRRLPVVCVWACLAMAAAGVVRRSECEWMLEPDHVYFHANPNAMIARVRGMVSARPRLTSGAAGPFSYWMYESQSSRLTFECSEILIGEKWVRASGLIEVIIDGTVLDLDVGDVAEMCGRLSRIAPPSNPGGFDWQAHQRRQGIWVSMSVPTRECIRREGGARRPMWRLWSDHAAAWLEPEVLGHGRAAGVAETMILGWRSSIDQPLEEAFARTGCAHLLAVSGSNLGILGVVAWRLAQFFRASSRGAGLWGLAAMGLYVMLVDPHPPVLRAAVMAGVVGLMSLTSRPRMPWHALALSALLLLMVNPTWIRDVSFLLSYFCMIGLVIVQPAMALVYDNLRLRYDPMYLLRKDIAANQIITFRRRLGHVVRRWAREVLFMSGATLLMTLPLLATVFQRVPVFGWLNTAIVLPLFGAGVVLGFVTICAAVTWPTLAWVLAQALAGVVQLIIEVVKFLDGTLGLNLSIPPPPIWLSICYYGVVAGVVLHARGKAPGRAVVGSMVLLLGLSTGWYFGGRAESHFRLSVLSVGRGLATVVELPGGWALVVDAGSSGGYDVGARTVAPFLHRVGVRRLDAVLISHANLDHFSGVPSLLDRFAVARIYSNPHFEAAVESAGRPNQHPADALLEEFDRRSRRIEPLGRGSSALRFGESTVEVLWPPQAPPWPLGANDSSLVVRITSGRRRVLLCGDIEQEAQGWLLRHEDLRADALVLPHHGSTRTTLGEFVEAVGAKVNITSNFRDEGYQPIDPGGKGVESASANEPRWLGAGYYHTGHAGAVVVDLSAEGITVGTGRDALKPR